MFLKEAFQILLFSRRCRRIRRKIVKFVCYFTGIWYIVHFHSIPYQHLLVASNLNRFLIFKSNISFFSFFLSYIEYIYLYISLHSCSLSLYTEDDIYIYIDGIVIATFSYVMYRVTIKSATPWWKRIFIYTYIHKCHNTINIRFRRK